MNRKVFMERLRELLKDLPYDEREEALTYYESYFDEAGSENENRVILELESPEKVAQTIQKELFETVEGNPKAPAVWDCSWEKEEKGDRGYGKSEDKRTKVVLLVILVIITFPVWVAVAAGLFGILMGIFGILFGCLAGILGGTAGMLASGIVLAGTGIGSCAAGEAAVGILLLGIGFVLLALGILALLASVWICAKFIPALCREIAKLFRKMSQKRKESRV